MSEIKPCPMCQSHRTVIAILDTAQGLHIAVLCRDCEACGPKYLFTEEAISRARTAWNAGCEPGNSRYLISKGKL